MRPDLALVYGGGGPLATAVGMGVADALRARGTALDAVPALGTSGGAWAAAAVRAGLGHERVADVTGRVHLPDLRPGRLRGLGRELFEDRLDPLLWTAVVRLPGGRRTLLWGGEHSVATIVAASSAVPFMLAPEWVGGRAHIDGGTRSWISADLAPDADRLIVIAPGIAPAFGPFGLALRRHLVVELRRWKRRTGGRASFVRIEEDLGRRVRRWKHLFDRGLAAEAYARARAYTTGALEPGGRLHDLLEP